MIAQPGQEPGQHRQQRHALAVDLDPEIEREPPAAALLDLGGPLAAAVDDAIAKAVLDLDPPAFAFELRHGVINEARPVAAAIEKGKRDSTAVLGSGAEGLDRAQPERLQPVLRRPLGGEIAAADDDAAVLDLALLARRVVATDQDVAIGKAEQCDVDPLLPILPPAPPNSSGGAARLASIKCRNRRIVPDLLDEVGPRLRQHEVGQVALDESRGVPSA